MTRIEVKDLIEANHLGGVLAILIGMLCLSLLDMREVIVVPIALVVWVVVATGTYWLMQR